jgi:hypothetical protein
MRVESWGVGPGVVTAALVFLGCISQPRAEGGPFGAGIIVGEPTGLSLKYFLDRRHAFDVAIDYSLYDSALYVHADYLLHFSGWLVRGDSTHAFIPYVGIGGKIGVRGHGRDRDDRSGALGARVPLGIAWIPGRLPIDVFLEVAPGLFLLPETNPDLDASLGLRYFF